MNKFRTIQEVQDWTQKVLKNNGSIGFVPTMGALHEGHLSLIRKAKEQNNYVICSIFVNPTQFDNKTDLLKYPRTLDRDENLLESENCDALFYPTVEEIYPNGLVVESFHFGGLENEMEGKFRPGHFNGVATIVHKFFEIIEPSRAYFGEKDFQQLRIIQEMVKQKNLSVEIIPMPIYREKDGLAMSSRNTRLTPEYRAEAPKIYEILQSVKEKSNVFSVNEATEYAENLFQSTKLELEYFLLANEDNLKPVKSWEDAEHIRAFVAAYAGEIRLIDNLRIK